MKSFKKIIVLLAIILFCISGAIANPTAFNISGRVLDKKTAVPLSGASIIIENTYLWAVSDSNGGFVISGVPAGNYQLVVSYLGYLPATISLDVYDTIRHIEIELDINSLALEGIVVTAQAPKKELNTTWVIGSNALEHIQVSDVSDIAALLPGGKTRNPDLTSGNPFSLRDGGSTFGNASFGTGVEVDGVRIGNNASFGSMGGVGTRNIAVDNIESIEVITGIPSAEYGDLNSGIVRINTRKGYTPWNIQMSVNPRTWQASFSKGFDLDNSNGKVNVSSEWTRAVRKLTSPYLSYTRRGISLSYSNIFLKKLKLEAGITGNLGGMNTEDDPDLYTGEYTKVRDNAVRANTSLTWLINKRWITNLKFDASINYNDNRSHAHLYNSNGSQLPAVHATEQGYFLADRLPLDTFFSDRIVDSKELDYAAALKYEWNRRFGKIQSNLKAGIQWNASGNKGKGEYYEDNSVAPDGYRPHPYTSYPYMHNVSFYAEELLMIPVAQTTLRFMGGLRIENLFVDGTKYKNLTTLSPRFNAKWSLTENFAVRGGWGIAEKLPSYFILYPRQQYRDVQTFGFSGNNQESWYVYYTQPYTLLYNENLKWQRNYNSELGIDFNMAGTKISLAGYYNITKNRYKYSNTYIPFSYTHLAKPDGYSIPENPQITVDEQTGMVYMRGDEDYWTEMNVTVTDQTFVASAYPDNGQDIVRKGVEMSVDLPEIKPVYTQIRLDAAYSYTKYIDNSLSYDYNIGWSHTTVPNRSYQYVGIYATGDNSTTVNGKRTHTLDANITATTHITEARIIITCRLEMSLLKRSQNLSEYNGSHYAFNVSEESNSPTGGSIYDGNSYAAVWPVAYLDLDGNEHPFTEAEANNRDFEPLIRKTGNAYTYARDGYDPYFVANLNLTKEIGRHVSLSFFANNFTNSRRYVKSHATKVAAIFIPDFYYGLTCRLKF